MVRNVDYFPRWVLLILALVVSHHIVAGTQNKPTLIILRQLNYYVAMAFSWPFTYLLMWWIHFCIWRLDRLVPWQASWCKRLSLQLACCVLLVILADVSVVRLYFWVFDNDFWDSGYMSHELLIILWMVLFMNSLYTAWFFYVNFFHGLQRNRQLKADLDRLLSRQGASPIRIDARLGNKVMQVSLSEIACFERHENIGHVHLKSGKTYYVDMTMPSLLEQLSGEGFFQINRSVLISLSVVSGFEKYGRAQALVLLVEGVVLSPEVSLVVSRSRMLGFRAALSDFGGNL
ncbi:LytR/AlgR family response regulator transcription factor [Pedobacter sp.]